MPPNKILPVSNKQNHQYSQGQLRVTDFIVLRKSNNRHIIKIVSPNDYQIGLDQVGFEASLNVIGNITGSIIRASTGFSGSLTQLTDGTSYLIAGSNITITTGSSGAITIATSTATGTTTNALTISDGLQLDSGTTFDGSTAVTLSTKLKSSGGLKIDSGELTIEPSDFAGAGLIDDGSDNLAIDISGQTLVAADTADHVLILDATDGTLKKATVATIQAAGASLDIAGLSNTLTETTLATGDFFAVADISATNEVKKITTEDIGQYLASSTNSGIGESSGKLTIDINDLSTSATINVGTDFIAFVDADDNVSYKDSISDLVTAIAGTVTNTGLASSSGTLLLDITNQTSVGTLSASDEIIIYDVDAAALKKTTIADVQSASAAPTTAQYVVLTSDATLTNERVLTAGDGLDLSDAGAGSSATLTVDVTDFIDTSYGLTESSNNIRVSLKSSAGLKFVSGELSIEPSDFAGTGLQDDGSDNLAVVFGTSSTSVAKGSNIVTVNAGDGLSGGGSMTIGNASDSVTLNIRPSDFAGVGTSVYNSNLSTYIEGGSNITITTGSDNQLVIAASSGGDIGTMSSFTVTADSGTDQDIEDGNTVTFTGGTGISTTVSATDTITIDIDDSVVATLTGSQFSGAIGVTGSIEATSFFSGSMFKAPVLSGSLTTLHNGNPFIIAGEGISISTGSDGSITITGSVGDITGVTAGTGLLGGGDTGTVTLDIDDSVVATLTGSIFSGTVTAPAFSGSLTHLEDGTSYIIAGDNVTVTSASNGSITIAADSQVTSPASPVNSVQFNNSGIFGGDSDFVYDNSSNVLTLSGTVQQLTSSIFSTDYAGSVSLVVAHDLDSNLTFRLPEQDGLKFQFLQTDSDGNLSFDYSDRVHIQVRNNSGYDLDAGTPIYITGYNSGGDRAYIAASSASLDSTMPAAAILAEDLSNNSNGHAALIGFLEGVDTSAFGVGNTLYVAAAGGLTDSKPLDADVLIQNVGFVLKAANNGIMYVTSPGRTNDVPNNLIGRAGLSGSLQTLVNGDPYLVAGSNITITTQSDGSVLISAQDDDTLYTAGTGLDLTAGVFSIDDSVVATLTGSVFSGTVTAPAISGSLTQLEDGSSYLIAGSNITISTGSNGAITISSTGGGGGSITATSGSTSIASMSTIRFGPGLIMNEDSSGIASVTASIGEAEDGLYTDGLFLDFTPNTPIGTAIDRFNEILAALSPSPAPALDDISETITNGITAYLSFGASNDQTSESPAYPSVLDTAGIEDEVDVNESYEYSVSGNNIRLGIYNGTKDIEGILNDDVASNSQGGGYTNYPANSFGDGDIGVLKLEVNGTVIKEIDLTVETGAGSSGAGTADYLNSNGSGFVNISEATDGTFSNGNTFSTFKHRTGEYIVDSSDQRNGWNYLRVQHVKTGSTTTTNYVEWVNDDNSDALASAGNGLEFDGSGSIHLSGVEYFQSGSLTYKNRVTNAYKYIYDTTNITFSTSNSATLSSGQSFSFSAQSKPIIDTGAGEDHTKVLHLTSSSDINANYFINGSVTVGTNVTHPLKLNLSNDGQATASGILMYNLSNTSTALVETFRRENYRIVSASYDSQSSVTDLSNVWDSSVYMTASNAGHSDGLQFYNQKLLSPINTINSGDFSGFANGPSENPDYSGETGTRTFIRWFKNETGSSQTDLSLAINGSSTIVSDGTSLTSTRITVLIKFPGTTGWMDIAVPFVLDSISDGDGAHIDNAILNFDSTLNATNYINFGNVAVANNEYILIKVLADESWTGNISQITVDFGAGTGTLSAVPDLDDIDSDNNGTSANLSFGSTKSITGYSDPTTAAGFTAADLNDLYEIDDVSNNLRRAVFNGSQIMEGDLNEDVSSPGNDYVANAFSDANSGSLKLEVNGSVIHTLEITGSQSLVGTGVPGSGTGTSLNGDGSGFISLSQWGPGLFDNGVPKFSEIQRTARYRITAASQRPGWNYARVIHSVGGSDRETNYVEWVNDSNSDALSSSSGLSVFGDDSFSYISGVKYFNSPSGSLEITIDNIYKNVYSDSSSAISFTSLTNASATQIIQSGSGLSSTKTTASSTDSLQTLNTNSDSQNETLHVTGTINFSRSKSLPGTYTTAYSCGGSMEFVHPIKSDHVSTTQTTTNLLVWTPSDTSNANTNEYFTGESYRLVSGSYTAQSDVSGGTKDWNSQRSINDQATYPEHATGLLIYDTYLLAPKDGGSSGDFRNHSEGGGIESPLGNVNYSSLTNSTRDYFRYYLNNTSNDRPSVQITLYGDATIVGRVGANAGTLGTNKNIFVEVGIPGKTGLLDLGRPSAGSGNYNEGDGCLSGDLVPNVVSGGATNTCTFNGQTVNGTSGTAEYLIIRISASENWTGYLDRLDVSWS